MLLEFTRRALLAAALVSPAYRSAVAKDTALTPSAVGTDAATGSVPIAVGTVALQNGARTAIGSDAAGAALYVTAKPADTGTFSFRATRNCMKFHMNHAMPMARSAPSPTPVRARSVCQERP